MDADVVIVGYGPVGQLAAALLGALGHRVTVFERRAEPYRRPRAVHYDHEIARILDAAGVSGDLASLTEPATAYEWRNAVGQTLLLMDWTGPGPSGWPGATMFSQPDLERVLDARVRRLPTVTVHRGWRVTSLAEADGHVLVGARGGGQADRAPAGRGEPRSLRARYLIGCDGANSFVRDWLATAVHDLGFAFDWLIADTIPRDPGLLAGVNRQICDPVRPTTMVSGGPGRRRWEWMLLPGESPDEVLEPGFVWKLLARSGVEPGDVEVERTAVYNFRARWALQWRRGPVLLAGDAAHLMPPFAGQGMGAGVRDVANLTWRLDLILRGLASDAMLDAYQAERQAHLQHAITRSVELGKVICVSDPAAAAMRDQQMLAVAADPALAPPPPPEPQLGPGTLLTDDATAGTLFPQGVVTVDGVSGRFDDVVGRGFILYVLGSDPDIAIGQGESDDLEALGGRTVAVTAEMDTAEVYRSWFAKHDARAVLVRPDFYVFGSASGDAAGLVTELRQRLMSP